MNSQDKKDNLQKFSALDEGKQERIINAGLKEFTAGYKNALTDNIVKEAGISKGLIFHYFGTKEGLYNFLIDYAVDIIQKEFVDKVHIVHTDVLENIWQLSLLKGELSFRYPALFDFVANAYIDTTAPGDNKLVLRQGESQARLTEQIFSRIDYSLFRDDIDPQMAIRIILWTIEGYTQSIVKTSVQEGLGYSPWEHYENYLKEFEQIIQTLRKCFYKH